MKTPNVILSALFAFSFIAALPLPADTSSLAYLAKKDITSLPQAIKRQNDDISSDEDSSGDGSGGSSDESGSDLNFLMKTRRQFSDESGSGGENDSSDEPGFGDERFRFLMKTRCQSGDSSGDDSWKRDGGEKHRLQGGPSINDPGKDN